MSEQVHVVEVDTLVWDLDGTALDSFDIFCDVLGQVAPRHELVMPDLEFVRNHYHGSLADSIRNVCGVQDEELLDQLIAEFLATQDNLYDNPASHYFPDAVDLMERTHAAGVRQVIVTNRDHAGRGKASPRHLHQHPPLAGVVERVVCGDDAPDGIRKPDPAVLFDAELGVCAVVGDQAVDYRFGHNLGAAAVGLVSRDGAAIPHLEEYLASLTAPDTQLLLVRSLAQLSFVPLQGR